MKKNPLPPVIFEDTKLYCSIREVAQMCGVNESTLRFWEKEFRDVIAPRKTPGGTRQYSREDVRTVQWIDQLVKVEGMTLEGARKAIADKESVASRIEMLDRLKQIRAELVSLSAAVDSYAAQKGT
jgi:DNA-binding transcriptional MerR regulator